MDERVVQFRVGVMVFATLIITAILVVMFGELPAFIRTTYTIQIRFDEAPNVTQDTPVRKSGILIGRVTGVQFAEDVKPGDHGVIVTAKINRTLRDDETCRTSSQLLGDAVIQVVTSTDAREPDGVTLKGQREPDAVQAIPELKRILEETGKSVTKASNALSGASTDMGKAARNVSVLLETNQDAINNAVLQATWTLAAVEQVASSAGKLIGDEETQRQLKQAIDRLPEMIKDTHETIKGMNEIMPLVRSSLEDMNKFTRKLGDEELIGRLDRGTQHLELLMREMASFSQALNDQQGSLGQLVRNPELYNHLNDAARNINKLTRQLEPIVRDVRVFTDKIARHPGVIVRDAVRPGTGTKY